MIRRYAHCLAQLSYNRRLLSSARTRRPTIHRRGDHPYGSREYLLCRPPDLTKAAAKDPSARKPVIVEGSDGMPLQVLATLKANKHVIFGASSKVDDNGANIPKLCRPLLAAALEDCQSVGEQPQALAALYGLCDYVKLCLDGGHTSPALQSLDETALTAVTAIATGVPREGHTIVGKGTHREGAAGWEALATEYLPYAYECQLYRSVNAEFLGIELLADTQPAYLKSAGGAMARYFFSE